jgi:hypothetical protein
MGKRILISGSMAGHAVGYGGNTWAFLQWILGFRHLGFDVYYVEERRPEECVYQDLQGGPFLESVNAQYFRQVIDRFELGDRAALLEAGTDAHVGLSRTDIDTIANDVDLFLNQFGAYTAVLGRVCRSAYLDIDPGQTQIWQEQYGVDMRLRGHNLYLTVGLNLGEPGCPLPTGGVRWEKTLPPVVLSEWETQEPRGATLTTVANWRDYSWLEWQGVWYAQKADAFKPIMDLPGRVSVPIELCVSIADSDPDLPTLRANGWHLASPRERVADPDSYRRYIHGSRGEFCPVRPIYSLGKSGWFSDRSACYLAAGRPVIIEDTGVGLYVPTGSGLLTFRDLDEAVAAIEEVESNYARHAAAARAFAQEYLDSDRVLMRVWEIALASAPGARPA